MSLLRSIRLIKGVLGVLGVLPLAGSLWLPIFPLRVTDKEGCARMIVAWVLSDVGISGVTESYPDSELVASKEQVFLVCDFLPIDSNLSLDRRVHRITDSDVKSLYDEFGFARGDYLIIRLQDEGRWRVRIEVSNWLGGQAGHGYLFTFWRNAFGLTAKAQLQWIS